MISTAIQQLVNYGLDTGLILPDDEIYIPLKHPSSCKVLYSSLLMWVLKDECYFLKNSGEGIREKEE